MNRYGMRRGSLASEWSLNKDEWGRDRLIVEFWGIAEAHVSRQWRTLSRVHPHGQLDELYLIAIECLVQCADCWPAYAEKYDVATNDKVTFWAYAKRNIDWQIIAYRDKLAPLTVPVDADDEGLLDPDLIRTSITQHVDHGHLHRELVEHFAEMPMEYRLTAVLLHFEGMTYTEAATVMGLPLTRTKYVVVKVKRAMRAKALASMALPIYIDRPPLATSWEPTPDTHAWLVQHYGTESVESYLDFTSRLYLLDVSYVLDLLRDNRRGRTAEERAA